MCPTEPRSTRASRSAANTTNLLSRRDPPGPPFCNRRLVHSLQYATPSRFTLASWIQGSLSFPLNASKRFSIIRSLEQRVCAAGGDRTVVGQGCDSIADLAAKERRQ